MLSRAFWTVAAGRGELRTAEVPQGSRTLRTLASGISRGTERLVFEGKVPPSEYATMRAPLMEGDFPFPVKYGYSAVGADEHGARFFVLHPHQDRLVAPPEMRLPVPDAVPTARAVLAANMETALNIAWDAAALPGERIAVVGAGVVGLLVASLLAPLPGADVTLVDIDATRADLAALFGCRFTHPDAAPPEQDLVVHASGTESGLRCALGCAAYEALVVEASWFGDCAPAVPLGGSFHARRLRLLSSQVGAVAPAMRSRRSHRERLALALTLLADPRYDALLEPATPFAELPAAMPRLLAAGLCHVVAYGDSGECTR